MESLNPRTSAKDANAGAKTRKPAGRSLLWLSGGFVALLGILAIVLSSPVGAFGGREGHGERGHRGRMGADFMLWKMDRMLGRIDATDEQRSQIDALLEETMETLREAHPDPKQMHREMLSALTAENIDREAIEAMRVEKLARFEEVTRKVTNTLADVAEVLTPEQRVELAELAEEHHGRHGPRRGRGRH